MTIYYDSYTFIITTAYVTKLCDKKSFGYDFFLYDIKEKG